MVEFTGLKKNAELHARYAGIALERADPDSLAQVFPPILTLTTTINDLRQAFFKVPPGKYLFHQTKAWANKSLLRDVEVKEGSYSVIRIEVFNPRPQQAKQVPDSTESK